MLAIVTLQAAAKQDSLCFLSLVAGLWKVGFPETIFLLTRAVDSEDGKTAVIADLCDGLGTLFHHSSAALIICVLQSGIVPLSRGLAVCIYPLIIQHWFAMLR